MTVRKTLTGAVLATAAVLLLTACSDDGTAGDDNTITVQSTVSGPQPVTIGTTDKVSALDPAGAYDRGSLTVMSQVYQFLYTFTGDSAIPTPDAAEKCEFITPTEFNCTLRSGLMFANGHALTSSDVKFSYDRMLAIASDLGPVALLSNLAAVTAWDDLTVSFTLHRPDAQTWPLLLATSAGAIVDEEVFNPVALTPDAMIVAANAFSGPYGIRTYRLNDVIEYLPNPAYHGAYGPAQNPGVTLKTFVDSANLSLAVALGEVDVAYRSLLPADIKELQANSALKVWQADGGESRYLAFNFAAQSGATEAQRLAVRQAAASLVDRQALATDVYLGQYTPLCSWVPSQYTDDATAVCDEYGAVPDTIGAREYLVAAEVSIPVELDLWYNSDNYGPASTQEYEVIQQQLETSGLFSVTLYSESWGSYHAAVAAGKYPAYQMSSFPDYPAADNYLDPLVNALDQTAAQQLYD
ncbi:MAG: ABC transporter substrate-binding protein, partial [Propionibacteriaceae bacterium]|nr:ABC transporter substrate-binding protein [Propionibacteriaceae bacterium]